MRLRPEFDLRLSPGTFAAILCWAVVGTALLVITVGMMGPWPIFVAACSAVAIVCVVVISGLSFQHAGVVLIGLFCFTASWDQASLASVNLRQIFLLFGGLILAAGLNPRRLPPVPWWLHAYGLSAVFAACMIVVFPVDESYMVGRYAASWTGQALGERGGSLAALLSLLYNNYAVPLVVVVACMSLPRALRWLIAAYVAGAALSCLAATLAYYGQPWLVDSFGGLPSLAGWRQAGFTSHPLRLATSAVLAMALACWLALQEHRGLKWCGRISVPLLIIGLYVSGSRGGIVAGLLVLALAVYMLPEVRRWGHMVVSGVGGMILGLYLLFPEAVHSTIGKTRVLGDQTTLLSDVGRAEVLEQGLKDFQTSPIYGIGVQFIGEAHTQYVGVLAGGGIILAIGYALFTFGSIRAGVIAVKVERSLGGALLATLIALLWYWTVADLFQTNVVAIIYGFVIALWWQPRTLALEGADDRAPERDAQVRAARV